jgi:glycosyltransferase involved in cell wall biosynthesis
MRLVLFAPNVHTGGGLTLLQALLRAQPEGVDLRLILDARARQALAISDGTPVSWTEHSAVARWGAEKLLAAWSGPGATVLCFHNLPPLFARGARVLVYQQNRLLLQRTSLNGYPWKSAVRLRLERWLSERLRRAVSAYLVQTPSMARSVQLWWRGEGCPPVRVVPFRDPMATTGEALAKTWDFVYVSDGEAHKNHHRLLQAWVLLAEQGLRPSLALTLGPRHAVLVAEVEALARQHGLNLHNTGPLTRGQVVELYRRSRALVFPSTLESFGLPLLEAVDAGLPVLAPELDYVRDVCEPVQTFDPESPVSIARAVRRHLGAPEPRVPVSRAEQFWELLTDPS